MIQLINNLTGGIMWVDDDRKDEYLAAGHRLAAGSGTEKTAEEKPKRRTSRPAQK